MARRLAVKREFLESSTISTHYKTKLIFPRKSVWCRSLLSNVQEWIVSMGAIFFIASNYLPQLVNGYSLPTCVCITIFSTNETTKHHNHWLLFWDHLKEKTIYSFSRGKLIRSCWYLKTALFYTHMRVENEMKLLTWITRKKGRGGIVVLEALLKGCVYWPGSVETSTCKC